jgi:lipopolysaccharide export system permease protein
MKFYNIYLSRKVICYFLVIFLALILLIWSAKAISFVSFITDKGVGFSDFFRLFILILPRLATMIIPISLFIAVLIVYNQMCDYNEIIIFKNSGLTNIKLANSTVAVAIFCCLICYYISFFLMPFTNKELRTARSNFNNNHISLVISSGTFETINKLTIYVQNKDENNQLLGILVYDERNPEYSTTITAQSGALKQEEQNANSLLLYLNNGTIERFYQQNQKLDILYFDSYAINLSDKSPSLSNIKWKANERYIGELLYPEGDSSVQDLKNYYIELHQRITYPLLSLILTLIAVSTVLDAKFSRHGSLIHNIKATSLAIIFIGLFIFSFNLIEYSDNFVVTTYLTLLIFAMLSLYRLKYNR